MARVLLIDGNPLLWRAAHSSPIEQVSKKILEYFFEVTSRFAPDDIVVCWDRGKSRWRCEVYTEYKAQRLQQKRESGIDLEALQEQLLFTQSYISALGVRQITVPGVEADDVLAWLAEYYSTIISGWNVVVATGDRDLWQLVGPDVKVYDHQKGLFVDQAAAEEHFGVGPELIPDLKALSGDSSDNLPGVRGVGPKTAVPLLEKYGGLGNLLDPENAKALKAKKTTARILPEGDFIAEMYRLVKIPSLHEGIHALDDKERKRLRAEVEAPLVRDDLRVQILSQRIGKSFPASEGLLPRCSTDLTGMVDYMEAYDAQNRFWGSLREVDRAIGDCNLCPLRSCCEEYGPTYSAGRLGAEIMIVGRNPGRQELENREPFYPEAPAGKRLDEFLSRVGVSREECWITNTCKCYSTNNRPPTYPELVACLPYLRAELDLVQPKLVIAFGNEAMSALTSYRSRVTKHSGEILENPVGLVGPVDAQVAISVHPSAALRSTQGQRDMEYAETMLKTFLEEANK